MALFKLLFPIYTAILSSALEAFYQECLKKDMIFQSFGLWLSDMFYKGKLKAKLSMVMGFCPFCHGFWLFTFFYFYSGCELSIFFFLYSGVNYISTKLFMNLFVN